MILNTEQLIDLYSIIANENCLESFTNCKPWLTFLNIELDNQCNKEIILRKIVTLLMKSNTDCINEIFSQNMLASISGGQINTPFDFFVELLNIYSYSKFEEFDSKSELRQTLFICFVGNISNTMVKLLIYYYKNYCLRNDNENVDILEQVKKDILEICQLYLNCYDHSDANDTRFIKIIVQNKAQVIDDLQEQIKSYFCSSNKEEFLQSIRNWTENITLLRS